MSTFDRISHQLRQLPADQRGRRLAMIGVRNLHYWLFQHLRRGQALRERLEGLDLLVLPGVFNPCWFHTTPVLVRLLETLSLPPGIRALELCTGTGAGALALARRGVAVIAVDINPRAVHNVRINARRNGLAARIDVRHGDLFAPVAGDCFDLIVANPPFLDGVARNALEQAFLGGPDGEVLTRLVLEAPAHLTPGGRLVLSYSSLAEPGRIEALAERAGLRLVHVQRVDLWSEVVEHYILEHPLASTVPTEPRRDA